MTNYKLQIINVLKRWSFSSGYTALIATILTLVVSVTLIAGFSFFSFKEAAINRAYLKSLEARTASESGVEDALYRILSGKQIGNSLTLTVGSSTTTITVTRNGAARIIRSEGTRDTFQKNFQTEADTNTGRANFVYGVQIGNGGLTMSNNSVVHGSVYANGNISGSGSATITGDAFTAGTSQISGMTINGNAQANKIISSTIGGFASSTVQLDSSTVTQDAHASSITNSTITRNAFYQSIDSQTSVGGTKYPSSTPPPTLPSLSMPIDDSVLDQWEADAAGGGTINCSGNSYTPVDGTSLGPIKINCDLIVDSTRAITVTGPIWVQGNFTIKNTAVMTLSSTFGNLSSVIIADNPSDRRTSGTVTTANSAQINGSGTTGSYLMVISRNNSMENGETVKAIEVNNSASAAIYYAPHGKINIGNNTTLKEATGYGIALTNSANLTYESGLQNVNFSSGPSGGWTIKYWKDVE